MKRYCHGDMLKGVPSPYRMLGHEGCKAKTCCEKGEGQVHERKRDRRSENLSVVGEK